MVRHRADALTQAVTGQRDDPFRVAWLSREDHPRLMEEATAIAMIGGRRVVRVRDAGDTLTALVLQVGGSPGDSLVVLEAGPLPGRSKLRAMVEGLASGVVIPCYPEEGRVLQQAIEGALAEGDVRLEADALGWLLEHVGGDRGSTRGEVEKLLLYAEVGQRLDLTAVRACVGDLAAVSFDDAVFAATAGDVAQADVSIERTLAEGMTPVTAVRGLLAHLGRLHAAAGSIAGGMSSADVIRSLRPPVFFKRIAPFTKALALWSPRRLIQAMDEVCRVEMACKQTGALDGLLVRRMLLNLARQGAALQVR